MFERDKKTGEPKRDETGRVKAKTSHSLNAVPFHVFVPGRTLNANPAVRAPGLANVAATVLHLLGYRAPEDYEASLIAD